MSVDLSPENVSGEILQIRLLTSLNVVCIAVLVYDYLITLGDEIEYVWGSKWNIGKILFLLIRYPAFLDILVVKGANMSALPTEYCQALVYAEEWLFAVGIGMFTLMLALRTWVIWNRSRKMTWILVPLQIALWIVMLVFASLNVYAKTEFYLYPSSVGNMGCLIVGRIAQPNYFFIDVAIGAFEICIFILTCLRVCRSDWSRHLLPSVTAGIVGSPSEPSSRFSPVTSVLYRDALLNYVLVLVLVNLGLLSVTPVRKDILAPAALGLQRAVHSILGSRTLLHMRKALSQARDGGVSTTVASIHFRISLEGNRSRVRVSSDDTEDGTESWFGLVPPSPAAVREMDVDATVTGMQRRRVTVVGMERSPGDGDDSSNER